MLPVTGFVYKGKRPEARNSVHSKEEQITWLLGQGKKKLRLGQGKRHLEGSMGVNLEGKDLQVCVNACEGAPTVGKRSTTTRSK